ncbi:ribonuclease P protein subunit p40-like isoform X2 [Mercenaria mercenaria]|uniref:ribonuclease P protein subunit p40-like isoform X2 n=1 Tax=Mercenaria mercenaria TaxID=6596 RepID=UPI00234E9482|nr:ribonuclease P protein subunit p40-like isoform X2 [Mercenaria mercenaria]
MHRYKMSAPMKNVSPTGKLVFERSSFLNEKGKHRKRIFEHPFNSSVHIMLPECSQIPKLVDNLLSDEQAYFTQQVPLDKLLDIDFIEGFIKAGSVQMISQGTSVDADDCVALLPTGKLVLNLCKDTFQQLGLNGQPSKAGKNTGKYVVQIDTLAEKFYLGMKQYERVKWCLTQLSHTDFLVTWKPNDEKVCPSSIQNYFINKGLQCSRLKLSKTVHEFRDINVPIIDSEVYYPNSDQEYCGYEEMFEWLGACAVGIDLYEGDGYVSTYCCPCPSREIKCCVGSQYGGFIHPDTVQQTIDSLRKYMKEKKLPWCSVTVNGFMDTPLSWQNDHGFHRNGDNLYTLLMFKNEDYWLFSAIGGCDICP